jgi:hypothetical protein
VWVNVQSACPLNIRYKALVLEMKILIGNSLKENMDVITC